MCLAEVHGEAHSPLCWPPLHASSVSSLSERPVSPWLPPVSLACLLCADFLLPSTRVLTSRPGLSRQRLKHVSYSALSSLLSPPQSCRMEWLAAARARALGAAEHPPPRTPASLWETAARVWGGVSVISSVAGVMLKLVWRKYLFLLCLFWFCGSRPGKWFILLCDVINVTNMRTY